MSMFQSKKRLRKMKAVHPAMQLQWMNRLLTMTKSQKMTACVTRSTPGRAMSMNGSAGYEIVKKRPGQEVWMEEIASVFRGGYGPDLQKKSRDDLRRTKDEALQHEARKK